MEDERDNNEIMLQKDAEDLLKEAEELELKADGLRKSDVLESASAIIAASSEILHGIAPQNRTPPMCALATDAKVLAKTAHVQTEVMKESYEMIEQRYVEVMRKRLFKDGVWNWDEMIKDVCTTSRCLSVMPSMCGAQPDKPLEEKVRKGRKPRQRTVLAQATAPEKINQLERKDKGDHAKTGIAIEQIKEIFTRNNDQPVPFYKLVLNPNSFMKSVMNIFILGFLVRDHFIAIDYDENGVEYVLLNKEKRDDTKNMQAIVSLDYARWNELVKKFNVTEAMLDL